MKRCIFFVFSLSLFACGQSDFAPPSCRAHALTQTTDLQSSPHEAACVSRFGAKLLVIQRPSGKYDLAYSENLSSDDEIPMQCKAHRATWKQTGFNAEVGPLLATQTNGGRLFNCQLQAGIDGSEDEIDLPPWKPTNVKKITYINPFDIEQDQWQNPDTFTAVRDAFVASAKVSQIHRINTSD